MAPRVHARKGRKSKMPEAEDFPPHAQRQIEAQQEKNAEIADKSPRKQRKGLLERLANVGLGRKEKAMEETTERAEPELVEAVAEDKPAAEAEAADNVHQLAPQIDPELDDDQLEIPAFLRRQAN